LLVGAIGCKIGLYMAVTTGLTSCDEVMLMVDIGADRGQAPAEADVVVIGAGHNALVCAAYLAVAGLEVVVLEARELPGGNTVTEDLTVPGFAHDSCSSAHVLIQSNPLLRDDELGLKARYGLTYLLTDPAVVMPQPDEPAFVMPRSLDGTVDAVADWSADDAAELRSMMTEWSAGLSTAHGRWSSALPPLDDDATRRYQALRRRSAWDVVHERFSHPRVRDLIVWMAMATIKDPRRTGTGYLPSSLVAGRLAYGWATPVGGSSALPNALIDCIVDHGGTVVCNASVSEIEVAGRRAVAVRTSDGHRVAARRGVVSSAHLATLASMLTGLDDDGMPPDLVEAQQRWRPGLSVFAVHAALSGDLAFDGPRGPLTSAAAGLGSCSGYVRQLDAFARGDTDADDPWLLVVNQTAVDRSRVPASGGATFKILTIAPYERADGRDWKDAKQEYGEELVELVRRRCRGLEPQNILALRVESPVDVAAHNPHNLGGSCHGGEFLARDGSTMAGWDSYLTSVEGLYLTGATTHPGGSVSGRPGRNAARAVLADLGMDPGAVMGAG
jgi:phytoene dehydrogenase-like protein